MILHIAHRKHFLKFMNLCMGIIICTFTPICWEMLFCEIHGMTWTVDNDEGNHIFKLLKRVILLLLKVLINKK